MTEMRKTSDIDVGKRYRKDLGDIRGLAANIAEVGLLQPVVITPDNRLIAGQRRLEAWKILQRDDIPVHVVDLKDVLLGEAAENLKRKDFLPSEMAAIAAACQEIEARKAAQRRRNALKRGQAMGAAAPPHEKGKTRDRIAKWFGVSGKTLEKIRAVMDSPYIDLQADLDRRRRVDSVWRRLLKRREVEALKREGPPVLLNKTIRPDTIVHGDYRKVLKEVPDETFHAVVTDPPYGLGLNFGAWQEEISSPKVYGKWIKVVFRELWRVLKPGGFLCLWQSSRHIPYFGAWFGHSFKTHAFCQKRPRLNTKTMFAQVWQPGLMWYKPGATPLMPEKPTRLADYFESDCWHDEFAEQHRAAKPLDVCLSIISSFVIDGGYVLDAFCGSGTIPLACKQLGRRYLGIEIAARYCELAELRIRKYGGRNENSPTA